MKPILEEFFNSSSVKLYVLNISSYLITLTDIDKYLSLVLLVISIGYTIMKCISEYRNLFKKDKDETK